MSFKKLAGAFFVASATALGAVSAHATVIDLGFSLDESGSVGTTNFNTTRDALADALALIPTTGSVQYRLAVTTFSGSDTVVIPPTIVTAANIGDLQDDLRATTFSSGSTDTAEAITDLFGLFANSAAGLGDTTIINISTDGFPNSQTAAENAALAAFNAGLDGLSFEAVGAGVSSTSAQEDLADIAGLGTAGDANNGVIVSDLNAIPDATTTGFVIPVSTFAAFEAAINAKIADIVIDTGGGTPVVPLPAGLPLLLAGLGAFAVVRKRQKA